jgi:hypothetical protein
MTHRCPHDPIHPLALCPQPVEVPAFGDRHPVIRDLFVVVVLLLIVAYMLATAGILR